MIQWNRELDTIRTRLENKETLQTIGDSYGVSRQRMYQVLTKYGLSTVDRRKKNWLRELTPAQYWLNRCLCNKKVPIKERLYIVRNLTLPERCPILGHRLLYDGGQKMGWDQPDACPSIDKIDPTRGYVFDNIQVISLRANRIKFNATVEELTKIANYMEKITRND